MIIRIFLLVGFVFGCSLGYGEEAVEIPLSEIWALNIPETKNVRELEPDHEKFDGISSEKRREKSLVSSTSWLLSSNFRPPQGSTAKAGFVVAGTGLESLKEANAVLANKKPPTELHPARQELSLIFFCYSTPKRVRFDEVTRTDDKITVKYHFDDSGIMSSTRSFALIPIGSFEKELVKVRIERLPDTGKLKKDLLEDYATGRRLVCDSFTFGIVEENNH